MRVNEELKNKLNNLNVLIVDDDETILIALKSMLSKYFNEVKFAYNGKDALRIFKTNPINLILSDITMPIMDGLEFGRTIRSFDENTKIIYLSGHNEEEMIAKIAEISPYIFTKPFNRNELFNKIDEILV